ncbi:ABC transporter permease [Actinomadura viridis]|uniref:Simple sugar transport system permease protein n=1 Tax=Actinomadura viridis TaxID=58110 RepID=A0A931GTW3_9ACTN|nr:ABC transporter permease [Actinomadura viridis]MBG6092479.1 simple sugar transport system permease protein [Actinomadura viridis]
MSGTKQAAPAGSAPRPQQGGGDGPGRRLITYLEPGGLGGGLPTAGTTVLAVAVALVLSSLLVAATGGSPSDAVRALFEGSLGGSTAWSSTLLYTAPLLLVAVGACISTRAGVFNLGQEGQLLIGALAGAWVALRLAVPGPALLLIALVAAMVAGGAWAGLSSLMHRWRGVNIVVSTLLMTFLAQQLVAFAVTTPWLLQETRLGNATVSPQSNKLPEGALLGSLGQYPNLQINGGLLIALLAAVVIAVLIARSRWGFRLTMLGLNPRAARHAGVRVAAMAGAALALSGAFAGLAGAILLTSPVGTNRLQAGISTNIGWDGLLVALVARNRPLLAIPVALLFGVLRSGGGFLAATGVPAFLVDVVKSLLVLAFVIPPVAVAAVRRRKEARRASAQAAPARVPEEAAL